MTKPDFIALADYIRSHNVRSQQDLSCPEFEPKHILTLADFCRSQNHNFMRDRWIGYIAGTCGQNGGKIAS